MTSSFLPDINVWLALHHQVHRHHLNVVQWFRSLDTDSRLIFCRHTQIGMFRLLTTQAVMGDEVLTQKQCWAIYAHWIDGGRATLLADPAGTDEGFEALASADLPSPKVWADAYLAAFAVSSDLTLVTFDKALAQKASRAVVLG
jgi:toxin-antitoxin system PIN domain toxin